jgi:hypothetical protein
MILIGIIKTRKKLKEIEKFTHEFVFDNYCLILETSADVRNSVRDMIAREHRECYKQYVKLRDSKYPVQKLCLHVYEFPECGDLHKKYSSYLNISLFRCLKLLLYESNPYFEVSPNCQVASKNEYQKL